MRPFRSLLSYSNVVATLALFAALGGGAYAAAGGTSAAGGNGAIKGCLPSRGGTLKVVKSGRRCPKGTVALTFNDKGRAGSPGPQGRPGPTGPRGPQGLAGPAGSNATVDGVPAGGVLTGSYPDPQLAFNAVTSANVIDRALTLTDLGGPDSVDMTTPVRTAITVPAGRCVNQFVGIFNPPIGAARGIVTGGMVLGTLTDAVGAAAVDNEIAVAPSMLILTRDGGTIANLILCNDNTGTETIPVGSVFHWRVIDP